MAEPLFPSVYQRHARLAGYATGAAPVWLWQTDGRRILWANAAAGALFGAASPAALTARSFDPHQPPASQISGLSDTLPANGSPRLAALEAPAGDPMHRPLCLWSRLNLDDATPAILAVATGPGVSTLPLAARVRWLMADIDAPVAAFASDGTLLYATDAAAARIGERTTLAALDASSLAGAALSAGHAEGTTVFGTLRLDRLGRDDAVALLVTVLSAPVTPAAPIEPPTVASIEPPAAPPVEAPAKPEPAPQPEITPRDTKAERHHPLRFVWQMEPDGRFTITSDAFLALIGPDSASVLGQPWIDVARTLDLDPEEHISRAIDSRETWSGITVAWPVNGTGERLTVEMSGLPMFDRERTFLGYRGFGVCRDAERFMTRTHAVAAPSPAEAETVAPPTDAQTSPSAESETEAPALSALERTAFRELARQLSARLKGDEPQPPTDRDGAVPEPELEAPPPEPAPPPTPTPRPVLASEEAAPSTISREEARDLVDRLPADVGLLVYRIDTPIYANRAFLTWSGDDSLDAFIESGGLDRLFLESAVTGNDGGGATTLTLTSGSGSGLAQSRLFSIDWDGERAHALTIAAHAPPAATGDDGDKSDDRLWVRRYASELQSIVDISTDGVVIIDDACNIARLNADAETLFGCKSETVEGRPFVDLLTPESRMAATADFAALVRDADARHPGREVRARDGGNLVLMMMLGRIAADKPTYCAVFRDISQWKRTEADLLGAKRNAEQASQAKSDFLAKISHEIRTPLNAIIGFAEVMMEERLGPIENERYRAYLKDIHASGDHLVALLNDLLDLSKIEAGKLDLTFGSVNLNELTQQCVALMQPQANRGRVIIRTSLAPTLPPIVADARSVRQILLNLLSNSIKFTEAGGQVIVSTTLTERGEAVLRVRDTGIGMSETEIETALEPFRQIETSARGGSGGTGLGLPLTKALAEANRAIFAINSNVNSGTLVEVAFPTGGTTER